jgi:hypothetical protein
MYYVQLVNYNFKHIFFRDISVSSLLGWTLAAKLCSISKK